MPDKESYNESIDNPKDKLKEDKERLINSIADVFEANKDNDGIKNIDDLFNKFRPIFRNYGYSLIINDIHTRYRDKIKAEYDKNPFLMPVSQQSTDTIKLNRLRSLNKDGFKKWLTDLFKENGKKKLYPQLINLNVHTRKTYIYLTIQK